MWDLTIGLSYIDVAAWDLRGAGQGSGVECQQCDGRSRNNAAERLTPFCH